jgi:peptide deformylase
MTILPVVTIPDKMLRQKARPVTRFDAELQQLIDNMIETMRASEGVGLAGPQVGEPIRLAVIETPPDTDEEGKEIEGTRELFVVANPEIIWTSRTTMDGVEGCLSIPGYVGEVERYDSIRVRAQDRYGKKLRLRLRDWTARIFQHEIDHLNGILYIDKLTAPENIWTDEEFEKMMEEQKKEKEAEQPEPMIGD